MNQETLTKAIEGNFDSMKTILNWAIILSLTLLWAGVQRQQKIETAGFKLDRCHALNFGAALYSFANIAIIIAQTRIGELLRLLKPPNKEAALTSMFTDPWILNPVSYITDDPIMVCINALGVGFWVLSWWLFFSSLLSVTDRNQKQISKPLIVTFIITSGLLAVSLLNFIITVGASAFLLDKAWGNGFFITSGVRILACAGGWLAGKWISHHLDGMERKLPNSVEAPQPK